LTVEVLSTIISQYRWFALVPTQLENSCKERAFSQIEKIFYKSGKTWLARDRQPFLFMDY